MRKQKKCGVLYTLFLVLLLIVVSLTGTSEAGVQLVPRVNTSGVIMPNGISEDYVVFGKYEHRLIASNGAKELSPTPIIWRVMSADAAPGSQKRAILLSHYVLDAMAYQYADNGGNTNQRPDGEDKNKWDGSEVQTWLNGTFLTAFSGNEKSLMLAYPDGTNSGSGSKVTLPSFSTQDGTIAGDWWGWTYKGELRDWFGSNDVEESVGIYTYGSNSKARRAHFKDASFTYDSDDSGWTYWTRSPAAGDPSYALVVTDAGNLGGGGVGDSGFAARPACLLNLELIIFKSASNDFDLSTSPSGGAGSAENPYLLVLPSELPNGAPVGWTTEFISADKVPNGAQINGKNMIVSWNADISPAVKRWPAPGDFKLSTGESPTSVTSDDANPKLLKLTFATGATYGATVKLSYNLNTDAISCDLSGTSAVEVVDSFANIAVTNNTPSGGGGGVTPSVTPTQVRFDGSSPADLKFLLSGAALTAANAGNLSIVAETPNGTRIPLGTGDYSRESRNLTILQTFLSKLGDGTHTIYLYNGETQVGKVTLTVTDSSGGDSKDSGSSGCNTGAGSAALFAMGIGLLGLNKAGARKKK